MKKELISKNKTQSLHRLHSYEDAKKHFPNEDFSNSKRSWRLFLDIDALDEKLLEDFTKHLLLFKDGDDEHYIVVNIGDQVNETSIKDKKVMKAATLLMKEYSVSDSFIKFIKDNKDITEDERIDYIKKFVPEIYLDYVIDNGLELDQWTWLPRNVIKKQLLSDPKYLSYLIKKDSEKVIKSDDVHSLQNKNESSIYIVDYLLSGTITKKTMVFLKDLFSDPSVLSMFQETIDVITSESHYSSGCSLTKSIVKNIFTLETESIISFNSFNSDFINFLKNNFKDDYLNYVDILIDKKVPYKVKEDMKSSYDYDYSIDDLFFDEKRFEYLISHATDLDALIPIWRENYSRKLFYYCFEERDYHHNLNKDFDITNLANMLKDPIRSKFVFIEDFLNHLKENNSHVSSYINGFEKVLSKTDLKIVYDICPNDKFFKENIVKHYTAVISVWDGKKSNNENYLERLKNVYDLDKDNINYISLKYLFGDDYEGLNEIYDLNYNSEMVQSLFETNYQEYISDKGMEYKKTEALNTIKRRSENPMFMKYYDSSKWKNKKLVEIIDPIVNFDTDFDLSELKDFLSKGDVNGVSKYCDENKEKIRNTFKHNGDKDFVKNIRIIASTLMG